MDGRHRGPGPRSEAPAPRLPWSPVRSQRPAGRTGGHWVPALNPHPCEAGAAHGPPRSPEAECQPLTHPWPRPLPPPLGQEAEGRAHAPEAGGPGSTRSPGSSWRASGRPQAAEPAPHRGGGGWGRSAVPSVPSGRKPRCLARVSTGSRGFRSGGRQPGRSSSGSSFTPGACPGVTGPSGLPASNGQWPTPPCPLPSCPWSPQGAHCLLCVLCGLRCAPLGTQSRAVCLLLSTPTPSTGSGAQRARVEGLCPGLPGPGACPL